MSSYSLISPSDGVPSVVGSLGEATASLYTRHAWLIRSGRCLQHHDTVHHPGSGVDSIVPFVSGPHGGSGSSAGHFQDVEIVYTDKRDVAAMCCLLHSLKRKQCETQTDKVPTATMSRFNRVLHVPNVPNLLLMLHFLDSGYGCPQRNSENSSLNFCLNTNKS